MRSDAIELCPDSAGLPTHVVGSTAMGESLEQKLASTLALVLQRDDVPWDRHFFLDLGADSLGMAHFCAKIRRESDIPAVSMRDIYAHPTVRALAQAMRRTAPSYGEALARLLAEVLNREVPPDSDFFEDLGADSLTMAHFCARVRRSPDLPAVAMRDVYAHSTINRLASALAEAAPPDPAPPDQTRVAVTDPTGLTTADEGVTAQSQSTTAGGVAVRRDETVVEANPSTAGRRAGTAGYVVCGVLQLAVFVGYTLGYALLAARGYAWIAAADGVWATYLRSVMFAGIALLTVAALPIVVKWTLVGRWRQQEIPVWSLAYFRFWLVKTVIRGNPLVLVMTGSPLFVLYLRALGAHVGRGVSIFMRSVPVCTDLLTIGDGTVIRKDTQLACYRAVDGVIQTGPVTLGADVVIGERTVLDIDTTMEDGAQLGHASSLHEGQVVPAGQVWHGSPAEPAGKEGIVPSGVDYRVVPSVAGGELRRVGYSVAQVLTLLLVYLPLATGGLLMLIAAVPGLGTMLVGDERLPTQWLFYRDALVASLVLLLGTSTVGLLVVCTVPRLLHRAFEPGRIYPLYGVHYSLHKTIARMTNVKFFTYLFGDSSYIVHYLQAIGYDVSRAEQTGSNFGTGVVHETPFLSSVGPGTMVADGLSIVNADFSNTSFTIKRARIGAHNFLGNAITFPAQSRTGDDCLLATKVMVPIDGPRREGVGLLGSPPFEIPRSVLRDLSLEIRDPQERRRRLHAKNRHNLRTIAIALTVRWLHLAGLLMLAMMAETWYRQFGAEAVAAELFAALLFSMVYFVFVERAATGFRRLQPQACSIYDRYFWWHERFWKLVLPRVDALLVGTPFKNLMSRALGVRIGRRVFDDGTSMPERTLVTIGDECTLNAGSVLQSHSQEDGAFKSGSIVLDRGCTVGVGTWVHYGTHLGEGATLLPDSFLMKGEEVPPRAMWGGNPAGERRDLRLEGQPRSAVRAAPAMAPAAGAVGHGGEDQR